jgi:hypothetical protein
MSKKFFDRGGKKYAGYGGLAGAGIYSITLLVSPHLVFGLMNSITMALTPYLGLMLSSSIGLVLPAMTLICGAALLAAEIFYIIKPDPVVQAAKLGVNLVKHAAGGFIPGGKGTIDALEDIGSAALQML